VRRWIAKYRTAEASMQRYVGLLAKASEQGNRTVVSPKSRATYSFSLSKTTMKSLPKDEACIVAALKRKCDELALSRQLTLRSALPFESDDVSANIEAAGTTCFIYHSSFYLSGATTPVTATALLRLVTSITQNWTLRLSAPHRRPLGRPWLTVLIDAFSRRCLAFYLTFDEPSYRSCMMILRDCVRRHSRLPQTLVLDGGRIPKQYSRRFWPLQSQEVRPRAARFVQSANDSSALRTASSFTTCAQYTDHTQRSTVTKSNEPTGQARWPLASLRLFVVVLLRYMTHRTPLGQTPGACLKALQAQAFVEQDNSYDHAFLLASFQRLRGHCECVTWSRSSSTASTTGRSISHPTVEIRRLVRYDPFDIVLLRLCEEPWTECHSEHYTVLQGV